jgi:hypothetical protein
MPLLYPRNPRYPPSNSAVLNHVQTTHGAGAGGEFVGFEAHALQHGDEEVRQGVVAFAIESQVLSVLETTTRTDHGQIRGHVRVGIPEVRAVNDHRAVEQRVATFLDRLQVGEKLSEQLHVPFVDRLELRQLRLRFPVVGKIVIALGDFHAVDVDGR